MCTSPQLPAESAEPGRARTINKKKRLVSASCIRCLFIDARVTHIDGVLISLHDNPEHLSSLQALLINQPLSNAEQLGERVLHNLIKLLSFLAGLEPIHAADGQQALQTCVDCVRIIRAKKLKGEIEESRPLLGEVVLEDLLEEWNQLSADIGRCGGQSRDQSLAEARLLSLRDGRALRVIFNGGPSTADTVLQVDTGWREEAGQIRQRRR